LRFFSFKVTFVPGGNHQQQQGVCHTVAMPFTIIKAKEELWKFKYFTMKKHNLKNNPEKIPKSFKIS
jgi:hypothetical protein